MKYILCILASCFVANVLAQDSDSEREKIDAIRKKNIAALEALVKNLPKPTEQELELMRLNKVAGEKATAEFREQIRKNIDTNNLDSDVSQTATRVEIKFDDAGAITRLKIVRSSGDVKKDVAVVNGLLKMRNLPASLLTHIKNDRTITSKNFIEISMRL
jgi:hypothetical protein